MEPLKPKVVHDLAAAAAPGDVEKYERLLSERFTRDPDVAQAPADVAIGKARELELEKLYRKLYPQGLSSTPSVKKAHP